MFLVILLLWTLYVTMALETSVIWRPMSKRPVLYVGASVVVQMVNIANAAYIYRVAEYDVNHLTSAVLVLVGVSLTVYIIREFVYGAKGVPAWRCTVIINNQQAAVEALFLTAISQFALLVLPRR